MSSWAVRFWLSIGCLAAIAGATAAVLGSDDAAGSPDTAPVDTAPAAAPTSGSASGSGSSSSSASGDTTGCLANAAAIEDIRLQRQQLEDARKELAAKEAELKAREQAVSDELRKLEEARAEIEKVDALHQQENESKVAKLVETLESMSPKAGAQLMSTLDETLAVTAMQRLSTAKLAKIMNLMEPARSSRLSEILAGVARARGVTANGGGGAKRAYNTQQSMNTKGGEKENGQPNNDPGNGQAGPGRDIATDGKPTGGG